MRRSGLIPIFSIMSAYGSTCAGWRTASWNVAAINNNPWEYYMDHPSPKYHAIMEGVQKFVAAPGADDVAVSAVFTEAMMAGLEAAMLGAGIDAAAVKDTRAYWASDLKDRKIMSGFLKDDAMGAKRLCSMPDRVTNTIGLADGSVACRPTVINMYGGELGSVEAWWPQWRAFFFEDKVAVVDKKAGKAEKLPALMLSKIPRAKYPALTEAEEAMSVPLQLVCCAVFDAVLVHMMNKVSPDGSWLALKAEITAALSKDKVAKTVAFLEKGYATSDVVFLQECGKRFHGALRASKFAATHAVLAPAASGAFKRDQASLLMLANDAFDASTVEEVTAAVEARLDDKSKKMLADGDVFAVTASTKTPGAPPKVLVASFHGDTNGLATIPVLDALAKTSADLGLPLVFGLDANAHTADRAKPGKNLGWPEFVKAVDALGSLAQCHDLGPDGTTPPPLSTFNARTYIQPQLNKAVPLEDKATSKLTDRNPKDYVVFDKAVFSAVDVGVDNTGDAARSYSDAPFPTLAFPSDHGVLRARRRRFERFFFARGIAAPRRRRSRSTDLRRRRSRSTARPSRSRSPCPSSSRPSRPSRPSSSCAGSERAARAPSGRRPPFAAKFCLRASRTRAF